MVSAGQAGRPPFSPPRYSGNARMGLTSVFQANALSRRSSNAPVRGPPRPAVHESISPGSAFARSAMNTSLAEHHRPAHSDTHGHGERFFVGDRFVRVIQRSLEK